MSLVQKPQSWRKEAVAEVLEVLRAKVRRCGECQVTTKSLGAIIRQRFGLRGTAGGFLREFVLGYLIAKDILMFWDEKILNDRRIAIYQVNTDVLNNI